jgi:hypothetical protein
VVKVFKSRIHYFFSEKAPNVSNFFANQEVEVRLTANSNWSNNIASAKAPLLNFFSSFPFKRNQASHYQRHLHLLTADNEKLDLRLSCGVVLD